MKVSNLWPRSPTTWIKNRKLYISVSFTWQLPEALILTQQLSFLWDSVIVGGPAVQLMPDYLPSHITTTNSCDGVLQRINPQATKTTIGCPNSCPFCAVPKLEGQFQELDDWPDLPIIIDNNLLAASQRHLDRVFDRLEQHGWADFNQGLDARFLTDYHGERLCRIKKPLIRLALDHVGMKNTWSRAFECLRKHGIAKGMIRTFVLIGFNSDPGEAWERCKWIESHGIKPLPMWFHELDALKRNLVTDKQRELGWTDYERRRIMQWFYHHKKAVQH